MLAAGSGLLAAAVGDGDELHAASMASTTTARTASAAVRRRPAQPPGRPYAEGLTRNLVIKGREDVTLPVRVGIMLPPGPWGACLLGALSRFVGLRAS